MSDPIEQEIQAKGLTAPRITPADIEAAIIGESYFTAAEGGIGAYHTHGEVYQGEGDIHHDSLGLLTFCVLVLKNGFTVTGESACASPENFDAELGRKIARRNAVDKIWPLMGYELKSKLATEPKNHIERMQAELNQLAERLLKLDAFTNSEAFLKLPEVDRTDLLDQGILMAKYRNKLKDRLQRAKGVK